MGVNDSELVKLNGFPKGINNVAAETSVPGGALRAAINVVLDDAGKLSRRQGYSKVIYADGIHSLYSHERIYYMLAVTEAGFVSIDETLGVTPIADVSRITAPMYYDTAEFHVLCGNGLENFRVTLDGTAHPLSPPQPAGQPTVAVNTVAGGLNAGEYQIAVTFFDALNRESGSTLSAIATVPEGGGIVLSNFPTDARATSIGIYMSQPNGDILYLVDVVDTPAPVSRLLGRLTYGRQLDTQFLVPMPPLTHLALSNGRLHGASDNLHVWSEALNYGLTNPATNYAIYNDKITLIARFGEAANAGVYLSAGKRTYYMDGPDPAAWQRVIAHPFGAIPGSLTYVESAELGLDVLGVVPVWMDTRGELIAGMPGGRIVRLHKDNYVGPENADSAASIYTSINGTGQLLAVARGGVVNSAQVGDSVDAEICRNGVIVG